MALENDVVLIYLEEQPMAFARVERILPDSKPNWYHVKLLILQVPLLVVTWILRDVYLDGDTFTMDGKAMRLEKVVCPDDARASGDGDGETVPETKKDAKIISLADLKKK